MNRWRYRPWQSAAVAVLAALLTACAAFAPLYYGAMQESLARLTLHRADLVSSSLQVSQSVDPQVPRPVTLLPPEQIADQLPAHVRRLLEQPVLSTGTTATLLTTAGQPPVGDLTWSDGACEHVTLTSGACPDAAGEIAVSADDLHNFGLTVGRAVKAAGLPRSDGTVPHFRLRVVGVYEQDASPYWIGHSLTGRSGVTVFGPPSVLQHDSWLTARQTFGAAGGPSATTSSAGFLVDRGRTGVDDLLALGRGVDAFRQKPIAVGGQALLVTSALPFLSDDVQAQIDQSRVTVPLLMAQLCLLAVVVLWLVLLAITEQRRPEVAVARLHGRGRRGAWRLLLGELLPVTLAAVVPGALLALLASWFARTTVLPEDVPFSLDWSFGAALLLAAAILTVVPVLAAGRVAREPVDRLLRRVPPRSSGWALGAADAVVIAAAGAVVVVFATGGLDGPIAMAAPGLLAIVVGLVVAHLAAPTTAALGRRLLRRGRVRSGVSVLDAARSPATRRMVAMVTLATALAVFSADALVIGHRNRVSAAEQTAGAPLVATVQTTDIVGMRAALEEADPTGTRVTPVVRVDAPGSDATATLGIVPSAFRRIALFPGGAPPPRLWDRLRGSDADPIRITGTQLTVDAVDSSLDATLAVGQLGGGGHGTVSVGVDLVLDSGETLEATLGELGGDAPRARLSSRVSCAGGCTLSAIWLHSLPGSSVAGGVTLRNLEVGPGHTRVPLGPADQWASTSDPQSNEDGVLAVSSTSADELRLEADGADDSRLTVHQAWLPGALPALVAGPLPPGSSGKHFEITGLDGESQAAERAGTIRRVPASAPDVYVVDLDQLQRARRLTTTAQAEVWFADDDPRLLASVTKALGDRDIPVVSTRRLTETQQTYDDSAAAWSLQLAALVGVAALLIALLVMVVSAVSSWRRRARDLAALRMSGVPTRAVRGMAVAAQLPAVVVGIVAGAVSGLVGAQLAMPIVPLFARPPAVSTLDLDTAWIATLAAAVAAVVVLVGGSVVVGRLLASRAALTRLRETL